MPSVAIIEVLNVLDRRGEGLCNIMTSAFAGEAPRPSKVVSLMDALRASISQELTMPCLLLRDKTRFRMAPPRHSNPGPFFSATR